MRYDIEIKGFSKVELLLVGMALIILTSGMFIYLRPAKFYAQIQDQTRERDLHFILDGLNRYIVDQNGMNTLITQEKFREICDTEGRPQGCVDLDIEKLQGYVTSIPVDPQKENEPGTGYYIRQNPRNQSLDLYAPLGNDHVAVGVSRQDIATIEQQFQQDGH